MKKKLFVFSFIMTAFPLVIAGIDALDQNNIGFGAAYLICGLVYAYFAFQAVKNDVNDNKWITLFGSLILLIVALDYFLQGKKYLPYAYNAAAVISLLPLLVQIMKKKEKK